MAGILFVKAILENQPLPVARPYGAEIQVVGVGRHPDPVAAVGVAYEDLVAGWRGEVKGHALAIRAHA